jgi:hypothetical protein
MISSTISLCFVDIGTGGEALMKLCLILIRGDFKEWWQAWNRAQFKFLYEGRCPREADAINRVPTSSPDKSGLDKQHRQFIASNVGAQFIALSCRLPHPTDPCESVEIAFPSSLRLSM